MSGWDKFVETFFNAKVMWKYLPDILSGVVVTIELALLIVVTGIAAGLGLALLRSLAIRPLNWLIIFVVDLFRSRQRDRSLRRSPFGPQQLADLYAGARPRGPL